MREPEGGYRIALAALVAVGAALLSSSTAAATPPADAARCDGVRILTYPYVAVGVGPVVIDTSGGLGGPVLCVLDRVPRRGASAAGRPGPRAQASGRCANAHRPGYRLRPRLAAKAVRCLLDRKRAHHGLRGLRARRQLKKAAKKHSRRMVKSGCFSHQCPGEPNLIGRVQQTGYLPCNCGWGVAENIAWARRRRSSPAAIVKAWMHSPPHRANILSRSLRDVDIGVKRGKPGRRKTRAATYTADFGYRG